MNQATRANPFVLVVPDNIKEGDHLKLHHRNNNSHIIVRVRRLLAPHLHLLNVLSFEDGEEYLLDIGTGGPCLQRKNDGSASGLWFLKAEIIKPEEAAEIRRYVAKRRAELEAACNAATRRFGTFEREVGRDYPAPKTRHE